MPFDGTDLGFSENHPLTKLGAVEWLLATKQLWCKFQLRDRDGRYCLVGAMEAVKARQVLEPIILRAAREVGGKHYWRIEFFNDDSRTSHADILRVLSLARENIVANIIKGHQRRSRPQRLAQAVRARWSGLVERAFKLAHKRAKGAVVFPQKFEDLFGLADADAQRIERKRRTHSGTTDDARAVKRVKFKLHDKQAAVVSLGRHLGLFDPKKREPMEVEVDIEQLRATILGRLARIAAARRAEGGEPGDEPRTITEVPTSVELVEREAAAAAARPKAEYAPGSLEDQALHPDWTPQED